MSTNVDTQTSDTQTSGLVQTTTTTYLRTTIDQDIHVQPTYRQFLVDYLDTALVAYLPLNDASGAFLDASGNSCTGAAGGATGPTRLVTGFENLPDAVSFPGSAAFIDWYTAAMAAGFNGAEGTLIIFDKVSGAGVWADGSLRYLARLSADADNDIRIARSSSNNNAVLIQKISGATSRFIYANSNAYTGWQMYAITWSAAGGFVYPSVNGAYFGGSLGAPGTWAGDLASTLCVLGASSTSAGDGWSGSLQHAFLCNVALTEQQLQAIYKFAFPTSKTITIIGDSIEQHMTNVLQWPQMLRDGYNGGLVSLNNRAVSGNTILDHMDGQVAAAVSDNADIIIIKLGTNDVTGTGVQAKVESNIVTLKSTNPNATIYYMNVLPRWTDVGGGTPVDKSYVRTPIAAACTAQSVTCWDTLTDPWIDAADTSDGLHPIEAGRVKITNRVLGLLP